jgi:hypothetical protein
MVLATTRGARARHQHRARRTVPPRRASYWAWDCSCAAAIDGSQLEADARSNAARSSPEPIAICVIAVAAPWLGATQKEFAYYHGARCHLSLDGDAPEPRAVQGPELGKVIELPEVGGLHHRYVRKAA